MKEFDRIQIWFS